MIEINLLKPKVKSYPFKNFWTGLVENWYTVIGIYVGPHYHQLRLTTKQRYSSVVLDRVRKVGEWRYVPQPEMPA